MLFEATVSVAAIFCFVTIIFTCLNCFSRKKPNISNFSSPVRISETSQAQINEAFTVDITGSDSEQVVIEPLPDITPKAPTSLPSLRPRITCVERGSQETSLSSISIQRSFPRKHLTYLNPLGSGWFGQAIVSDALKLTESSLKTQVVVKLLKDDASKQEQKRFLDEITPFRLLGHVNVMGVLGQCIESSPYLIILEYAANGDLKAFLQESRHEVDNLLKKKQLYKFASDVAAGLSCLHRREFVHNDLAARNCLVMGDLTVKIGDYGITETLYKEDYYDTGKELLPIRWMAPETLCQQSEGVWLSMTGTKASDMWSFGIVVWEIFSMGERPYELLTDEAVLQGVVLDHLVLPSEVDIKVPGHEKLNAIMQQCWRQPGQRGDIDTVAQQLNMLVAQRADTGDSTMEFDLKWNRMDPRTASDAGSKKALAGSFDAESVAANGPEFTELDVAEKPKAMQTSQKERKSSIDELTAVQIKSETSPSKAGSTPVRAVSAKQPLTTSTPISALPGNKADDSTLQMFSANSSVSTAYDTASEMILMEPTTDSQEMNSLNSDVTLNSSDPTLFEPTSLEKSQVPQKLESDEGPGKDFEFTSSPPQQEKEQLEPENESSNSSFGDFERTSPTSPMTDFTEFTSADNANDNATVFRDSNQNNAAVDKLEDVSPQIVNGIDIVAVEPLVAKEPSLGEVAKETPVAKEPISSEEKSSPDLFPQSPKEQQLEEAASESSTASLQAEAEHLTTGSSTLNSDLFTSDFSMLNSSVGQPIETSQIAVEEKEIDKQSDTVDEDISKEDEPQPVEVSQSIVVESEPASLDLVKNEAPPSLDFSLSSEPSLIETSNDLLEVSMPQPQPEDAFAELNKPTDDDFQGFAPLEPEKPSVSDVLEETQQDLLSALNDSGMFNSIGSESAQLESATKLEDAKSPEHSASLDLLANDNTTSDNDLLSGPQESLFDLDVTAPKESSTAPELIATNDDLLGVDLVAPNKDLLGLNSTTPNDDLLGLGLSVSEDMPAPAITSPLESLLIPNEGSPVPEATDDEKVGIASKHESASNSTESGILSHTVSEASRVRAATWNSPTDTSDSFTSTGFASQSDLSHSDLDPASQGSPYLDLITASPTTTSPKAGLSLYRANHICLSGESSSPTHSPLNHEDIVNGDLSESQDTEPHIASPVASDNDYSTDSSSCSGSGQEYDLTETILDTGQPPTPSSPDSPYVTSDAGHSVSESTDSADDFDEEALQIASEIYLSRGVKSPRVFEILPLETIPEHQAMPSISEIQDPNPTPSDTSSVEVRYEDLFGNDGLEWDDFIGDSLVG